MESLRSRNNRLGTAALAALSLAALSATGYAATNTYTGPNGGSWYTASNWSENLAPGVGSADDVVLGSHNPGNLSSGSDLHVVVNSAPIGSDYINITLNSSGLPGYMILDFQSNGWVVATSETIGTTTADNTINQTGGSNEADTLNLGMSSTNNYYDLSGGTLYTENVNVGVSGGGTINQSGGSISSNYGTITLGENSNSFGTYNLSGSGDINGGILNVAGAGSGVVNQTGGTVELQNINVGSTGGGTGNYTLSSGTITCLLGINAGSFIDVIAGGTFNYNGGTLDGSFTVNSGGVFNLQPSGVIQSHTNNFVYPGGTLVLAGGTLAPSNSSYTTTIDLEGGTLKVNVGTTIPVLASTNGGTVVPGAGPVTLTLDPPANNGGIFPTVTFAGVMKDGISGILSLNFNAPGATQIFTGASTYSGPTSIQGGIFQAGANGAFSPNSNFTLSTGGTLDAATFSETISSLAGTAGTVNVGTGGNLAVGAGNAPSTYAGTLTGAGTFTKAGSGNLTLTGGGSFTGTIAIQNGNLLVGAVNGLPTGANLNFTGLGGGFDVNANQSLASFSAGLFNSTVFANNSVLTVGSGNVDTTFCDNLSGTGTFIKTGTGNLTVGLGSIDNFANTDAGVTFCANAGTLTLNKSSGTVAVDGGLNVNGGTVLFDASNQTSTSSTVAITAGTFNLNGFTDTIGYLSGTGGNIALNGGTFNVNQGLIASYAGTLTGPGAFIKSGFANLTLSNISAYNGAFVSNGGQLTLQNTMAPSAITANSGGTIEFSSATLNVPGIQILANSGGTIEYLGSTISNAYLRGNGTHTILAGATSTFNGVTTYTSTTITQNGPANFNNFTNGGTINSNAALSFSGVTNSFTGTLNVNSNLSAQDFGNDGIMNIAAGATLTNAGSNLILGGGSRTYIGTKAAPGGNVTLTGGTTLEVNGALLVNNGTISGTTDVNYGGTAEGTGTYGPVNVTFGGVFQPGISSSSMIVGNNTSVSALSGDGTIDNVAAAGNITLNVNTNVANSFTGTIQNSNGTLGLNLNGGSLTLLTHPITGGNSINTYTGGTTITSGSLIIGAVNAFPAGTPVLNNGSFFIYANSTTGQITGNGQLTIGSVATGNAVATIAPKSGLSTLASLSIIAGSKLDLTNNDLIIHNGNLGQTIALLAQGYSHGAWTGSTGIVSSVAALSTNRATTLGAATGLTTFDGQSVQPSDVLIKYTWVGDANLDGVVNSADLSAISSTGTTWQTGDFNYDGVVNADDYALFMLGSAYGSGTNISATLPEPAIGVIGAGSLLVWSGRRRRI